MANSTLTVSFTTQTLDDDGEIDLTVELDDEANKEANNGRTSSFLFGDDVYFKVFKNPLTGVNISTYQSDGNVTIDQTGVTDSDREEFALFSQPDISGYTYKESEKNDHNLEVPCNGVFSVTELGSGDLGVVSLDPEDPSVLVKASPGVVVGVVTYDATYDRYKLSGVTQPTGWVPTDDNNSYPVIVVIVGTQSE